MSQLIPTCSSIVPILNRKLKGEDWKTLEVLQSEGDRPSNAECKNLPSFKILGELLITMISHNYVLRVRIASYFVVFFNSNCFQNNYKVHF